jgi:hypothetical protein
MTEEWMRPSTIAWLTGYIEGLPAHCSSEKYRLSVALQLLQATCSCGDPTILGVIHSDTKPCSLPTVHMPLTDDQILKMAKDPESDIEFARSIEAAHGITGITRL